MDGWIESKKKNGTVVEHYLKESTYMTVAGVQKCKAATSSVQYRLVSVQYCVVYCYFLSCVHQWL